MTFDNISEWWEAVDKHWGNLGKMMGDYLNNAELDLVEQAKLNKNGPVMHKFLNETWWRLPDKPWIRKIPGFFVLCDLCSEYPEEVN